MTTVDVTIRRIDGPAVLYLHNGMFGPATTALHALIDAYLTGIIQGNWHSTYIDTTLSGATVRSVLAAVDEHDPEFWEESDRARFIAFRDSIDDNADYAIKAIEV